ncbi:hypothetical protein QBC32DRAFT_344721 [Pseudoneurospora amorphoporcata]|uniref:Uncharacterized protein n=1 Tax=Pseudoneurospora amorphoporcata TaxID=241081 RepID=A0AAN6NSL9_9PEZI|nr:hypothetical protein QBC32DRAFT_344721 [Pseudoneurospora amorphoporcata]
MAMDNDDDKEFYASYGFEESGEAVEVVRKSAEESDEAVEVVRKSAEESDEAMDGRFVRMVLRDGEIRALVKERRAGHMDGEDKWTRWRKGCKHIRLPAEESVDKGMAKREDKQPGEILEKITRKQEILEDVLKKLDKLKEESVKLGFLKKETSKEEISKWTLKEQRLNEKFTEYITKRKKLEKEILELEMVMESLSLLKDITRNEQPEEFRRVPFSLTEDTPQNEQPGQIESMSLFGDVSPPSSSRSLCSDSGSIGRWMAETGNIEETANLNIAETIENREVYEDERETE